MIASALSLGLLGLAAAAPTAETHVRPHYPPPAHSNAFRLAVNVTDHTRDFTPSIQNSYIASIHVGPGFALVGSLPSKEYARIFYQNGTANEHSAGMSTVITDSGTPPFPSGLKLVPDEGLSGASTAHLDAGLGTPGVGIAPSPEPYAFLLPDAWMACNESIPYYRGQYFVIFKQAEASVAPDGSISCNIPDSCVPVRLIPECAELNVLPDGSYSSHEYAIDDRCYAAEVGQDQSEHRS